jgi:hypothetical protein
MNYMTISAYSANSIFNIAFMFSIFVSYIKILSINFNDNN